MSRGPRIAGVVLAAIAAGACRQAPPTDPRMVPVWMQSLYGAVRVERLSPPVASRVFAYASTALYYGLESASPDRAPTAEVMNRFPELPRADRNREYDATLVAVAAERVTVDSLFREGLATTRAAMDHLADSLSAARVAQGVSSAARTNSDSLGRQVGLAIVQWGHGDGFDSTRGRKYVPPVGPGLWINDTPASAYTSQSISGKSEFVALDNPANAKRQGNTSDRGLILSRPKAAGPGTLTMPAVNMAGVTEPYWGYLRPFAMGKVDVCPAPLPPPFSTKPGSPLYKEARLVFDTHAALTPDQKAIALYWADNAGETGTPGGHWLSIASQMVGEQHLTAPQAARLMMMTSAALADAFIVTWRLKFTHNLIRPRTYIRAVWDSTWEPTIPTPPFPEFVSGHSALSAAAATTMTSILGTVAFDDSTNLNLGHPVRKFDSFMDAAREAGLSRIYGGIHFPSGNVEGRALGQCVGGKVFDRLKAVPAQ